MRGLKRNQKTLYYQIYQSNIPVYEMDLDGNIVIDPVTGEPLLTGETKVGYAAPVQFRANVSAARGESSSDPFGIDLSYDKTMVSCDMTLPIDELSVLFVDKKPEFDAGGNLANTADYKVVKVAKSLNSVLYAIRKVTEGSANG
ncbi:hypothetical protein [Enterocloster clostridioformis]|uniref:hypothetical protein n=1 Tax=Enterocloster clostridioformis TaxID=1531 RepID=UPI0007407E37|nr:hypothetical protein [Enterocloster clostridioformis]CUX75350.1 hypothetical protein BN3589_04578 [Clostridium sp. C105KSO14]